MYVCSHTHTHTNKPSFPSNGHVQALYRQAHTVLECMVAMLGRPQHCNITTNTASSLNHSLTWKHTKPPMAHGDG